MKYVKGAVLRVSIEGHPEPVLMQSIEMDSHCAGGGVMLIAIRSNVDADSIVQNLNGDPGNETQG